MFEMHNTKKMTDLLKRIGAHLEGKEEILLGQAIHDLEYPLQLAALHEAEYQLNEQLEEAPTEIQICSLAEYYYESNVNLSTGEEPYEAMMDFIKEHPEIF